MTRSLLVCVAIAAAAFGSAPAAYASPKYANCTEARADGRTNIPQGDPDYWPGGDRDKDGYACDA